MKHNPAEIFPIVTETGEVVGSASRAECHNGSKLLHPVVHLHILDGRGNLYLQQRAMTKDIQPGKWDTAVGGHVDYGESPQEAIMREAFEELGVNAAEARFVERYVFESSVERELVHTFVLNVDAGKFKAVAAEDEISDSRFWSRDELSDAIGRNILTPNLEMELTRILHFDK